MFVSVVKPFVEFYRPNGSQQNKPQFNFLRTEAQLPAITRNYTPFSGFSMDTRIKFTRVVTLALCFVSAGT